MSLGRRENILAGIPIVSRPHGDDARSNGDGHNDTGCRNRRPAAAERAARHGLLLTFCHRDSPCGRPPLLTAALYHARRPASPEARPGA